MNRKVLVLVNAAPYSRPYFEQLEPYLNARGFDVVFALDSHLTDVVYDNTRKLANAWYFTDFTRDFLRGGETLPEGGLTWNTMFSDFDRFLTMEIPTPLGRESALKYAQIPALLQRFFTKIFEVEKPCAVLYEAVSNCYAFAAYHEALRARVPFASLFPSRIAGRIEISMTGGLEDHVEVGRTYRNAANGSLSKESIDVAANYIRTIDQQVPDYMKPSGAGHAIGEMSMRRKYLRMDKFRHVLRSWRYVRKQPEDCALAFQHGSPLRLSVAYVKRAAWRRLRQYSIARYYQTTVLDEPFLIYPLHFHPEASTSVLAQDFIEELSLIKSIAFRLPTNMRLYVKEHPSAVALQPRSFYKQLDALPNVRLLSAGMSAKALIRKSRGVICVTSTLGFEAAVLNKPVISFGDVLYGYFPNVRMIREYSALDAALKWMVNYQPVPPVELLNATAAYVEFGAPGSFDFNGSLGNEAALKSVADEFKRRLDAWYAANARR